MLASPQMTGTKTVYKPLTWQISPLRDKSPIMLLTGSAGGGKSRLAAEKVHAYMLKYPGAVGIVGRKDKTSARKSVVQVLRHRVMDGTTWGAYNKTEAVFRYNNGSRLWVVGMRDEEQREALRSIDKDGAIDIAWWEEANKLAEQDHNETLGRMRGRAAPWSQVIYTTNPDAPTHWIYKRLIKDGEASVYYSGAKDNPYNPPQYIDILEKLTGVQYQRLVLGKWVQAEGAVYDEYDPAVHLINEADMPEIHRWIVGVDFGFTNPFVATLWGLDADDRMYLYKQVYYSKRIVEDHAPAIKQMIGDRHIEAWITDHDAEDRATLERHLEISTQAAYKDVSPGIQAVKQRLTMQADGKPRLFIVRGAVGEIDYNLEEARRPTCTEDEVVSYAWEQSKDGRPIKEQPVKINDHGMDEMRYVVAYVDDVAQMQTWSFDNIFYD